MKSAALGLLLLGGAFCAGGDEDALPWEQREDSWRTDRVWYDGQAEKCVYAATRSIYGVERRYEAIAYTNKQLMDPETTTKSTGSDGVEVFKHHWSERVPTEKYDYDFSTVVFQRTADLAPFKLTAATQEDCGASFKQIWREDEQLRWFESVYHPGAGMKEGRLEAGVELEDSLTLVLRDLPFEELLGRFLYLELVDSQKSPRSGSFAPERVMVWSQPKSVIELPVGPVEAYRVELYRGEQRGNEHVIEVDGKPDATYWFAADGSAPWLHALLRYEGPNGVTYELKSIERTAYWARN